MNMAKSIHFYPYQKCNAKETASDASQYLQMQILLGDIRYQVKYQYDSYGIITPIKTNSKSPHIFSHSASVGVIRTALAEMDREAKEHYAVVIQAKDMAGQVGGLSGSTTINITLTDVNDNPPNFPQSESTPASLMFLLLSFNYVLHSFLNVQSNKWLTSCTLLVKSLCSVNKTPLSR